MIRLAELAVFLAPLTALILWRVAVARGLDGPTPRHLLTILAVLVTLGGALIIFSEEEHLPPGRYIPAHSESGSIVPGHAE
jgi:hypothetical protein